MLKYSSPTGVWLSWVLTITWVRWPVWWFFTCTFITTHFCGWPCTGCRSLFSTVFNSWPLGSKKSAFNVTALVSATQVRRLP